MKYIVILGDGMADYKLKELDNKTPLMAAHKPNMDYLAKNGETGLVKTLPEGFPKGSDVANLSVFGYSPKKYYTGRSPIEAVSIGIDISDSSVALRCNLVTLSDEKDYSKKTIIDYCADEISTGEANILIEEINKKLGRHNLKFYTGTSYRHCLMWEKGSTGLNLTPPHDITGRHIKGCLPENKLIYELMEKSYDILNDHPVNEDRRKKGLKPANSIWLWGEGKKLTIPSFYEKYSLKGSVISAVDLVKGLGICAGLDIIDVKGATGNIDTNFKGKAKAAVKELKNGKDFVYLHMEAPDECGHRHEIENKVKSIELIDKNVVGPVIEGLKGLNDFCILLLPDHPTPLCLKTHTGDPVPFIIYRSSKTIKSNVLSYDEEQAGKSGLFIEEGYTLMDRFIKGK